VVPVKTGNNFGILSEQLRCTSARERKRSVGVPQIYRKKLLIWILYQGLYFLFSSRPSFCL